MGWLLCFFVERSCCILTLLSEAVIPHYQCIQGDHPILRAYWEQAFQETEKWKARSLRSRRHTQKQWGGKCQQRDVGGRDCGPGGGARKAVSALNLQAAPWSGTGDATPGERHRQLRPKHWGGGSGWDVETHSDRTKFVFFLLKNLKQTKQKVQVLLQLDSGYIVKLFCFSAWLKTLPDQLRKQIQLGIWNSLESSRGVPSYRQFTIYKIRQHQLTMNHAHSKKGYT